ncbi:MICOS complex subunit Mic10-like [Plodia interpunctella]|uniref:MICOS complex subunit Mic10-like n=1 Tax=Plodia interpunctella TaxID=58824 RepID=UPI002367FAB7|nr:MICOS complex subunit Mic10-like [Plodia interpunctella]
MGKKEEPVDEFSLKLDACLTDTVIKTGGGVLLGALTSVLFLGRRRWPIIAGMGMGLGIAYANCELEINPKKKRADKRRDFR